MAIDSNASLSQPPARSDGRDRIAVDAAIFLRFALSRHAEHRIEERSTMTSAEILELLNAGRAVRLNDPFRHFERRAHYLIFSRLDNKHLVAVTRPATTLHATGIVVTVLERTQYEHDRGLLDPDKLLLAARSVLDRAAYEVMREQLRRERKDATGLHLKRSELNVHVHCWDADFNSVCLRIGSPRVPTRHLAEHGLAGVHRHPDFWHWLRARLQSADPKLDLKLERIELSAPGFGILELDHREPLVEHPCPSSDAAPI